MGPGDAEAIARNRGGRQPSTRLARTLCFQPGDIPPGRRIEECRGFCLGQTGCPPVLASEILSGSSTLTVRFQLAIVSRALGRRALRASSCPANDQLPFTPQQELCRGEELHDPRQPRHWRHVGRAGDPAAALTDRQGGLHLRLIGRGRAHHRVPPGPPRDVRREDRRVTERQGVEGVLYLLGSQAGPHERVGALGIRKGRQRSTCVGELPLLRSQVGPHRRVEEAGGSGFVPSAPPCPATGDGVSRL